MEAYLTEGMLKTTVAQIASEQGISTRYSIFFFCPLNFPKIEYSPPYSLPLLHPNVSDMLSSERGLSLYRLRSLSK